MHRNFTNNRLQIFIPRRSAANKQPAAGIRRTLSVSNMPLRIEKPLTLINTEGVWKHLRSNILSLISFYFDVVTRYSGVQWMLTVQNDKTAIRNCVIWRFNRFVVWWLAALKASNLTTSETSRKTDVLTVDVDCYKFCQYIVVCVNILVETVVGESWKVWQALT